jgi:hypothetical protein
VPSLQVYPAHILRTFPCVKEQKYEVHTPEFRESIINMRNLVSRKMHTIRRPNLGHKEYDVGHMLPRLQEFQLSDWQHAQVPPICLM